MVVDFEFWYYIGSKLGLEEKFKWMWCVVIIGWLVFCWVWEVLLRNILREFGFCVFVRREICIVYVYFYVWEELICSCDFFLGLRIVIEGGCLIIGLVWVLGCEVVDWLVLVCFGNFGMFWRCYCVRFGEFGGWGGFGWFIW